MANSTRVMTLYDRPMWESLERQHLELQKCSHCNTFRYPPGPVCAACLSLDYEWTPISGGGEILSWVRFHRRYFDDYPVPYNAIAVRLDEGPILVSTLIRTEPEGEWIGRRVAVACHRHLDRTQHVFMLAPA